MDDTADTAQVIIRPPLAWGLAARYSRPIATKSEVEAQKPLPTLTQSSPMLDPEPIKYASARRSTLTRLNHTRMNTWTCSVSRPIIRRDKRRYERISLGCEPI